jgi:hypothetical protein
MGGGACGACVRGSYSFCGICGGGGGQKTNFKKGAIKDSTDDILGGGKCFIKFTKPT